MIDLSFQVYLDYETIGQEPMGEVGLPLTPVHILFPVIEAQRFGARAGYIPSLAFVARLKDHLVELCE